MSNDVNCLQRKQIVAGLKTIVKDVLHIKKTYILFHFFTVSSLKSQAHTLVEIVLLITKKFAYSRQCTLV